MQEMDSGSSNGTNATSAAVDQPPDDVARYSLVVFGATGFTGQFVVEQIARTIDDERGLTWAVAGRDLCKLQTVLAKTSKVVDKDLSRLPTIIADVDINESLVDMCKRTNVLINCVGPYSLYGKSVVKACIAAGTHHIDISGEPAWLESIHLGQNDSAKQRGVYILESCGFDSIPADLGVVYTKKQFTAGDLNSIECFLTLHTGPDGGSANYGTWQSAIRGFAKQNTLKYIRKALYQPTLPHCPHRIANRSAVFYESDEGKWCVPFPGSDRAVVYRSEYLNWLNRKQRPVQFKPYFCVGGVVYLMLLMLVGLVFTLLTKFEWGIHLLETYPRLFSLGMFSHTGPTRKQMAGTSFTMKFVGSGYTSHLNDVAMQHTDTPTARIVTQITGPEPGYVATPIFVSQAAYVLLSEQDKMPQGGGVMTPGYAFANTSLIERLQRHGIKFSVAEK